MAGGFGKLVVLFRVGGVGCLVHFLSLKVDGVKTEVGLTICDVIWVLFKQIELFLDPPGLRVVKVLFVLGLVLFVPLEHHEAFFTHQDVLYEEGQILGRLRLNAGFRKLRCAIHI